MVIRNARYGGKHNTNRKEIFKMPAGADKVEFFDPSKIDKKEMEEFFNSIKNTQNPDGSIELDVDNIAEARYVANVISNFHGEAEIDIDDDTGKIKVKSKGKGKGKWTEANSGV